MAGEKSEKFFSLKSHEYFSIDLLLLALVKKTIASSESKQAFIAEVLEIGVN
jgi:hypothetical protein